MDYQEALDFMFSRLPMFQRVGPAAYKADLSRTIELCRILENPQDSFPGIHIAGTNGKGSVASLIAATLQSSGYRTGLFTSPHLADYRERIRVNGKMISEDFVTDFINEHHKLFVEIQPSFFEMSYGLAAAWFRNQKIDIAVWETGMGGRLDSTNIITPVLSIITNIGIDHTQFLGDTLELIAVEKAGIIKESVPVLIGERQQASEAVFARIADEKHAPIRYADELISTSFTPYNPLENFISLDVSASGDNWITGLECGLAGIYQQMNIRTALAAIRLLSELGYPVGNESIVRGFRDVRKLTGIAGRWLKINESPPAFCDTGHNVDGIRKVLEMLDSISYRKLFIVLGAVDDKEIGPMLDLLPPDAEYLFCKSDVPRAMPADKLARLGAQRGMKGQVIPVCREAFQTALSNAGPEDFVFIGGSTFVVAEVIAMLG